MSNGAVYGKGTYFYSNAAFLWIVKIAQLLTVFIGIWGMVKVFEEHDVEMHGALFLLCFVTVELLRD